MTRRMQHYDVPEWRPWLIVAAFGALMITVGIGFQIWQLVYSIRHREELRDTTGDPWDGRSLEWATSSPPPLFNFAVLPNVRGEETYWVVKRMVREGASMPEEPAYVDIEMPLNSPVGFICAFFATIMGFSLIWHIWWLVIAAFVGAFATFVVFAWRDEHEELIPAATVAKLDRANRAARTAILPDLRPIT